MRNLEDLKEKEFETSEKSLLYTIKLFFKNPKLLLLIIAVVLIAIIFFKTYEKFSQKPHTAGENYPVKGKVLRTLKKPGRIIMEIKVSEGTPVKAVLEGKVIFAGFHKKYGLTVILKHKYGYYTLYGRLGKINVIEDVYVKRGYTIGYASYLPLHYEFIKWYKH